jgi:hypothetical protein
MLYLRYVHLTKGQALIGDKPILLSQRMLRKDHDSRGSVAKKKKEKNYSREPQRAWRQDEMIDG